MYGIHITAQGGDGTHQVRRAACAGKPLRTPVSALCFQQGAVIETVPIQVRANQDCVVQSLLHAVRIFAVLIQKVHPLIPVRHGDGRTDFTVGLVIGQYIVVAEPFRVAAGGCGADTARNIRLLMCHRIPDCIQAL